jgi:hypothetical protein
LLIELSAAFAQPALATVTRRQRPLRVDLNGRHGLLAHLLIVDGLLVIKSLLGVGQRRPTALARAKALRQLITPSSAVALVILAVGPLGLIKDL